MADSDSDGTVVLEAPPEVKERTTKRDKARPKKQPPYAVIVENDDFHTFEYVIEVLQKVCGHDLQKAFLLTSQVHYAGQALVWSGALELAELKRDQIRGFGTDNYGSKPVTFPLGVRIEQLPG
ncbi:MAG TPA: ATP-dependent Clp protease adaptor ClpS [Planctomycetaceae bacterium]|nr:ATP-dependent Clp protease adaptor ClpS [Planctomycetaceae bacterium]